MARDYSRFAENFIKRVAEDAARPTLYKGKPQVMMPEDDEEAVADFFKKSKSAKDEDAEKED